MKLFGLLIAGLNADRHCPSVGCWDAVGDICNIKTKRVGCDYLLECGKDGMVLTFPHAMFGTDNEMAASVFNEGQTVDETDCLTKNGAIGFKWTSKLGECGQEITQGSNDAGENVISFSKTMLYGFAGAGPTLDTHKIYTSGTGSVSITFKCQYKTSATATSDLIDITAPIDVAGDVTVSTGEFDGGLTIAFYDETFTTVTTAAAAIGATLYPKVTWSVTSLSEKVGYYVHKCEVLDMEHTQTIQPRITIIRDSCYAKVVNAQLVNQKFATSQFATFKYDSFSFNTNAVDKQKLSCAIEFCLIEGGFRQCSVPMLDSSSTCPNTVSDAPYEYTWNGQ